MREGIRLRLRDARGSIEEGLTHIEVRSRTAAGRGRIGFAMHLSRAPS